MPFAHLNFFHFNPKSIRISIHFFWIGKLHSSAAAWTGELLHKEATQSLVLLACYCRCCWRCSEELRLGCLTLRLQAFIGDYYLQQLEDPCLHILQDPPVDTSLYDPRGEHLIRDEGSIHRVVGGALPLSPVLTVSCS